MNFILSFFLRDIEGIIKFFQRLETRLATFIEEEKVKVLNIEDEIADLVKEKEGVLGNVVTATTLRDKLKV